MHKLPYHEVLRIFSTSLDEIYYSSFNYVLQYKDEYYIFYSPIDNIFKISHNNKKILEYLHFCSIMFHRTNDYGYIENDVIYKIPCSKEEWFEFSIMHDCTEEDFNNFLKIVNYIEELTNKKR